MVFLHKQAAGRKKKDIAYYINSAITIAIMLGFWFIPPQAPLTQCGVRVLGALLGAVYGWCTVDIIWPSFLSMVCFALSGFTTGNGAITLAGGNTTTLYILFLFFFAGMFISTNTAPLIAQRIISAKIARGRPWMLTLMILFAAFIPSIVIGGVPGTIIVWNIIYAVCEEAGLEKGSKWGMIMVVAVAIIAAFGHNVLPFQVSNAATFGILSAIDPSSRLPYAQFILITTVYAILAIFIFWLYIRFIVKPDVSKLKNYDNTRPIQKFEFSQKLVLWMFALLFIMLMLPSMTPKSAVGAFLSGLGNSGIVLLVLGVALLFRKDGKKVIDFSKVAATVPWHAVIMIACAMCISGTFKSDATGINAWLTGIITPFFSGRSPLLLSFMILLTGLVLANLLNNVVVAFMMVPILYSFHSQMGPALSLATMIMFMCEVNMAFIFPSGSTSAALLAANRDWVKPKELFLHTGIGCIIIYLLGLLMLAFGTAIL